MNSGALEMKLCPPMPFMCTEILEAVTCNTWKLPGIIYSVLTVEMCNSFAVADTIYLQFSKAVFQAADNWFVASEGQLER